MIEVNAYSSLDKIFKENSRIPTPVKECKVLLGERYSYQILVKCPEQRKLKVAVNSPLADYVKVYRNMPVFCDLPVPIGRDINESDEDYLVREQCNIPDALIPLSDTNGFMAVNTSDSLVWVRVDVPKDFKPGRYDIEVSFSVEIAWPEVEFPFTAVSKVTLEVLPEVLPENELRMTQWFHTDCIASVHGAEIFSERHWDLIDKYMAAAYDIGINMLLTPIHTPPLDTAVGSKRPVVQLVDIEKCGEKYVFDFAKLGRWIQLCKKNNIKYLEMAHLFTQWGAKCSPNILVTENGKTDFMFGWQTAADSVEYREFLKQYVPAVIEFVTSCGYGDKMYFHISDEPVKKHLEVFMKNVELVRSLTGDCKIFDALSDIEFFKNGAIKIPVCASDHIGPFLDEAIDERWVYYCCGEGKKVSNRFMSMSGYRNRIMGIQMYKFGISGFLQWGFNFYFSGFSRYTINPYLTSSADLAFQSGDPFTVYPAPDGAYHSARGMVFYEALQDIALCKLLENKLGKEAVVKIIDETAGFDVRFDDYPKDDGYLFKLREKLIEKL